MEKMKKIVSVLLVCITLFSVDAVAATATQYDYSVTMYAADGRTVAVPIWEIQTWKNVGWYDYPVVTMYAPDGRSIVVAALDVYTWENVGWIDGRKTTTIYAPDGRTATVPLWQLQQYLSVGWYDYPVYVATSYYPGTSLPKYDFVVSGTYISHEAGYTEGGSYATTYWYKSDYTSKNNYIDYLRSIGWEYFDAEVEDESSTWVLTGGNMMVLVTYYYYDEEVYVTFGSIY